MAESRQSRRSCSELQSYCNSQGCGQISYTSINNDIHQKQAGYIPACFVSLSYVYVWGEKSHTICSVLVNFVKGVTCSDIPYLKTNRVVNMIVFTS